MKAYANGLAMLAVFAATATAQTNWITAHPDFRVVDGQLYNTAVSVKWTGVKTLEVFRTVAPGLVMARDVDWGWETEPETGGETVARELRAGRRLPGEPILLRSQVYQKTTNAIVLIRNTNAPGAKLSGRMMKVGETNIAEVDYVIYDLGEPHRVPVK